MKILHVTGSMDPLVGGASEAIRNLAEELDRQGVYNEVICADDPKNDWQSRDTIKTHYLGPARTAWHYSRKIPLWLDENLDRFDAVIIHGCWLYPGFATAQALRKKRTQGGPASSVPAFFLMPHGMLDPYFQQTKGRKLKAVRNWLYWKLIEGKVVRDAQALLFTCQQELLLASDNFRPYNPKKTWNVGLGIKPPPAFTANMKAAVDFHYPQLATQKYFLFLSRIHPKKGLDILVEAYQKLREIYPDLPSLVIAGPGRRTSYGKKIRSLVDQDPRLANSVIFTGMIQDELKWGMLYGCEAFLLASHQENFGIAVVEALGCAKPVIISNKVNIWQEISDHHCGLATDDNVASVYQAWNNYILMNQQARLEMADQAQQLFRSRLCIESAALTLLEKLQGLGMAHSRAL